MKVSSWSALAAAVMLLLALTGPASAHADLETCTPAPNAVLTAAPAAISCTFAESVDLARSALAVFDANNNQVDSKDTRLDPADADGTTLIVSIDPARMQNGTFRVQWTAVSKEDAHRSEGQWTFSLNAPVTTPTGTPPGTTSTPATPPASNPNPPATAPDPSGTPATGDATGPVKTPPAAVLPPGPSASDLPQGKGGVWARNYWGLTLSFTLAGTEYQIPANDDLLVILDPARYPYSANVFGEDDTEVMAEAEVKAGQITELGFFLKVKRSAPAPEEGGEEEGGGEE